ncbi:MAG TPA: hemolysin family protein [Anaeromyxobacter sp.]|nr:hemolysin family protein [Anaeromyxobacter sp.]
MASWDLADLLALAALAAALLVVRAVGAAFEAALVAVGSPRAQDLARPPDARARARALADLYDDPERTAFTGRALVTLATVFAGFLAGALGASLLPRAPWVGGSAGALAAALVSLPLAALGRGLGARHGEAVALALAPAFRALRTLFAPLRAVVGALAVAGRFSLPPPPLDEMERALAEYAKRTPGAGVDDTSELIHNVFEFREKVARDVMVPRTDVVAVEVDAPVPEIIRVLAEEGHSRMPVYRENLDQIEGVLHARDLVPLLAHPELIHLRDVLRPAHFVPWSKPIDQLLREMQRKHLHMAFVVDEHGGIMGLCTIEDVLEQIVGDIRDEFDEESRPVESHADGTYTVLGETPVADFNASAAADVPEDQGYETMAGFLNSLAGAIPGKGERLQWRGWAFTVADADPRKVTKIRAARVKRA